MNNYRIDMRLSGTIEDLAGWIELLVKLDKKNTIRILEQSAPYQNRDSSEVYRVYVKAEVINQTES